jgi:AbrB family looped-hinge helix DNA binding protein
MISSKITSRGQTTLPKEIREALGLKAGSKVAYEIKEDIVLLRKPRGILDSFAALKRDLPGKKPDYRKARAEARESWTEEASREDTSK